MRFNQKVTAEMVTSVLVEKEAAVTHAQDLETVRHKLTELTNDVVFIRTEGDTSHWELDGYSVKVQYDAQRYVTITIPADFGVFDVREFVCELENELCKAEIAAARDEAKTLWNEIDTREMSRDELNVLWDDLLTEETPAPTLTSAHLELFKMFGVPQAELYKVTDDIELDDNTILEAGTIVEWAEHPMQHDDFISVRLPNGRIEWVFHTSLKKANF